MRKVRPGDKLEIPAAAYNAFVDAARDTSQRQHDLARALAIGEARRQDYVLIRNESGGARDRCDILGINGVLVKPTENLDEFKGRIVLRCGMPQPYKHRDCFVVLLDAVPNGGIGRACVSGVCITRVIMNNEMDKYAVPHASAGIMYSGFGTNRLLWVEPPEERQNPWAWCVVRIGSFPHSPQLVRVVHTGGPDLVYSIYEWWEFDFPPDPMPQPLATNVVWQYKFTVANQGAWQPAPYWSTAIAEYRGAFTNSWRLLWCQERLPVIYY